MTILSERQQQSIYDALRTLQQQLVSALAAEDNTAPRFTDWNSALGSGRGCTLSGGELFERGGINYSQISGKTLPAAATIRHPELAGCAYQAAGVSLVLHPHNPYCPTVHLNVRWFAAGDRWWFGGGMDLTPYYAFIEDCRHFHGTCKAALDSHNITLYPLWKKNCDDYFFIRHRNEARGIGGIFFDDYNSGGFAAAFAVFQAVGNAFLPAYLPLLRQRRDTMYSDREREWQKHRRGRYVEFNLIYDRGTLFGLQSGGNADAILMSLPPAVCWGEPAISPGKEELALITDFLPPQDWAAYNNVIDR